MKGVLLDQGSLDPGDLDLTALSSAFDSWDCYAHTTPGEVARRIHDADVVISNKVVLDQQALQGADRLQLICVAATGVNNIDLEAATAQGIPVCNVRGYATASVVEHVFAMLLTLVRRLAEHRQRIREGAWQQAPHFCLLDTPIQELAGRTLGIVGHGELGRQVAEVARAFGMQVLLAQRPGGPVQGGRIPLHELLAEVDVLSLHCPLTETTRGLIGAEELALMKQGAILINTARGGIVDEAALLHSLTAGHLGGAGIDVLAEEPPLRGNPLLDTDVPNLIVTPHVAWASQAARQRLVNELVANIQAFQAGTLRNAVTG